MVTMTEFSRNALQMKFSIVKYEREREILCMVDSAHGIDYITTFVEACRQMPHFFWFL